ncbi:MAG TPA: histidine kinase dimerization/phospho-acceptor domain-containing protein, partial [Chloroflexota bacterium]|nr:histidine kinase dimerization/phospho-acceptor domain-containing protein [Chloroflexota bacterium]
LLDPATSIMSIVLLPASLGAAILSRQFLGIDRLVRRGIVALGIWLGLLGVYSAGVSLVQRGLSGWGIPAGDLSVAALIVIVTGGTFSLAQARIRRVLERLCFHDIYDYSLTLRTLSVELVQLSGQGEAIATHTLRRLEQILDLSWAAVALSDGIPSEVTPVVTVLTAPEPVYRWGACPDGLNVAALLAAVQTPAHAGLLVRENDALLPLVANGELVGVLAIGQKRRDVDLSPDDVVLLETLAPMLTTAFQNARHLRHLEGQVAQLADGEEALRESNTRLSRALVELNEAQQNLVQQERLRALGEMAAGIAHDFNNSLSPIVGFSDFLLEDPGVLNDAARARRLLELIRTGATDAAGVVGRLREFYRPPDDVKALVRIDLSTLAEQVIALTEPRWKNQPRRVALPSVWSGNWRRFLRSRDGQRSCEKP